MVFIIYSNYYQCSCTVLSNMADNKRIRGDRDENQENRNECKSAKAIKLLREVTSLLSEGDSEPYQPALCELWMRVTIGAKLVQIFN